MDTEVVKELNKPLSEFLEISPGISYTIDRHYTIVYYTKNTWNGFAQNNNTPEYICKADNLIGKNIFDFINGEETISLYQSIYEKIFTRKISSFVVNAHCDAPNVKRDSVLLMSPISKNSEIIAIVNQSVIVNSNSRPSHDYLQSNIFDPNSKSPLLKICSICANVENDDTWITGAEYYRRGGRNEVQLTHGICPNCLIAMKTKMKVSNQIL